MRAYIPDERLIRIMDRASPHARDLRPGQSKKEINENDMIMASIIPEVPKRQEREMTVEEKHIASGARGRKQSKQDSPGFM
jgi:hypothetical protein